MELEQFLMILVAEFDRLSRLEPDTPKYRAMSASEFHQYKVGAQESLGIVACQVFMTAMPGKTMDDFKNAWNAVRSGIPLITVFPPVEVSHGS